MGGSYRSPIGTLSLSLAADNTSRALSTDACLGRWVSSIRFGADEALSLDREGGLDRDDDDDDDDGDRNEGVVARSREARRRSIRERIW